MDRVTIGGKVLVATNKGVQFIEWIEHENRAWLTPLWIVSHDRKTQRPLRIIAPRFAPGYTPPGGPEILEIFQQMQLPESLLEQGVIPSQLLPLVEVRENPDIFADCPSGLH